MNVLVIALCFMAAFMIGVAIAEMTDSNEGGQVELGLIGAILALGFVGMLLK